MQSMVTIIGMLLFSDSEAIQMVKMASMSVYNDSSLDPSLYHRYKIGKNAGFGEIGPSSFPKPFYLLGMSVDLCLFCISMVKKSYSRAKFPELLP